MTNWPTAPLIRIIRGTEYEEPIDGSLAVREDPGGEYLLVSGPRAKNTVDPVCARTDSIDEWEEVTAVPTAALKRLQDAFRGIDVIESLEPPLLEVLYCLPADKPSALDRAAALARELKGPRVTPDDTTSRRLAILLEVISFTHASTSKVDELTEIARTCADWLYIMNPNRVGLDDIETSAREIDRIPDDEEKRYMSLTYRFAQAATLIGEGDHGGQEIMELGAYALAWAAQIIEEEDK
jgi:hypothetical protein|nr:MAG TPA: hypothetical protein [Caudoviricetes sp.]